ncbi:hypothetical protein APHCRT_0821 [Anaplasma phagocytophilum str. CRT53-1]|uniref:Uncharacterized protein n=1 Tax=Anaplasma phagocytophilum str. CRT53-1 TaxID=1359157 RepID=A0A0F3PKW8_ANAPH|nr:hypothetical protein APHCRT_1636 [Anaplasma phagocytophilum str. CRT53-1]KJV85971.1 hypothetical protein APHCRT_0821 [Anaplasma phagocytophilum str. CRT53-1]
MSLLEDPFISVSDQQGTYYTNTAFYLIILFSTIFRLVDSIPSPSKGRDIYQIP